MTRSYKKSYNNTTQAAAVSAAQTQDASVSSRKLKDKKKIPWAYPNDLILVASPKSLKRKTVCLPKKKSSDQATSFEPDIISDAQHEWAEQFHSDRHLGLDPKTGNFVFNRGRHYKWVATLAPIVECNTPIASVCTECPPPIQRIHRQNGEGLDYSVPPPRCELVELQAIDDCTICLLQPTNSVVLSCKHSFCNGCIEQWITTAPSPLCPLCKQLPSSIVCADGTVPSSNGVLQKLLVDIAANEPSGNIPDLFDADLILYALNAHSLNTTIANFVPPPVDSEPDVIEMSWISFDILVTREQLNFARINNVTQAGPTTQQAIYSLQDDLMRLVQTRDILRSEQAMRQRVNIRPIVPVTLPSISEEAVIPRQMTVLTRASTATNTVSPTQPRTVSRSASRRAFFDSLPK